MAKRPCPEKEAHWRAVFERQKESGLNIAEFCRTESISVPSFYQWRRVIRGRDQAATEIKAPKIVPLTIEPEHERSARPERYEMAIRIPGGIEVVISQNGAATGHA